MSAIGQMLKELYEYRELLWALTYRDIRVRYKQAVMGMLWALFLPLLAVASGIIFRAAMAVFGGKPLELDDVTAVMVKSLPWLLFSSIVGSASNSLVGNTSLISKIYFPREVIPLASVLTCLIDFSISLIGLAATFLVISIIIGKSAIALTPWLLMAPVLVLILVLLAVGLGLLFGAANLFLRDVKYIVQVMLQFGIFFSLVFFTVDELGRWGWVMLFNPVAALLEGLRMVLIEGSMPSTIWPWLGYSTVAALLSVWIACIVFEKAEALFAEYA